MKPMRFDPQLVINAAGPWIDFANHSLGFPRAHRRHEGLAPCSDHPELRAAIGENEFFFENKDGRIVLIFPLA
jgi:glycerol-3-phosphate dehydrogenase